MKKLLCIIVLLYVQGSVLAQDIVVTRTSPKEVKIGDILSVDISITNLGSTKRDLVIEERIEADVGYIGSSGADEIISQIPSSILSSLRWNLTLAPNTTKFISYKIKSKGIGYYMVPPTKAYDDDEVYLSEPLMVRIRCNQNNICEINEDYFNCPEDCPSGSKDGICDLQDDGVCDPDCISGDPDCERYCGDNVCSGLENYMNCPQDCPKPLETLETTTTVVVTTTTLPLEKPKDLKDYLLYIAILFTIILLAFLIYRKLEARKLEREKEEFRIWKLKRELEKRKWD